MLFQSFLLLLIPSAAYAQSLASILSGNSNLTLLASLVNSTNLGGTLSSLQNITVLAPSNNAISTLLNSSAAASLGADPGAIQALLEYHILKGTYYTTMIGTAPAFASSLLTNASYTNVTGGQVVEGERVNDRVMVISGLLANSTVTQANINFTGGTLHVIDRVLTIPANASTTLVDAGLTAAAGALTNASLVTAADELKDITIFAPNNAAFAAVASGFNNASSAQIAAVLKYHVVNGSQPLYSTSLMNGTKLTALDGNGLTIYDNNGTFFVNNAKIVYPNILISEGVIHVIDEVLNPSNTTASPSSGATAGSPAFSGASSASGTVPFTSGVATVTSTIGGGAAAGPTAASSSASGSAGGSGTASSSSSKAGANMPRKTGSVGTVALVGAAAGAILIGL